MAINSPVRIPKPWANSNTLTTIPTTTSSRGVASWDQGFPVETSATLAEGGVPPRYIDFNTILNNLTQYAVWMQSGGQATWANDLDYPVNALVWGSDSKMYQAVQENGVSSTVQDPTTDTNNAYWKRWTADCLPLSGGTMTGGISLAPNNFSGNTSDVHIGAGTTYNDAGTLVLRSTSYTSNPGGVEFNACNGSDRNSLKVYANGSYTVNNKTGDTIDSSSYGSGSGWIRYTSGLQVCFGAWTDIASEKTVSFNKSFKSGTTPCVSIAQTVGVNMYVNTISHETCKVGASSYNTARSCRYVALGIWK